MHPIIKVDFKGIQFWFIAIKYEDSAFKGDACRWMIGKTWLPEMEGYRMLLLNIDVRRFLDDKHNSKLADTVSIDLRQGFDGFHS